MMLKQKQSLILMSMILEKKDGRYFAVTKSQSGPHECWRVLSKADGERLK